MQQRKPIKSPTPPIPPKLSKQFHHRLKSIIFISMTALFSLTLLSLLIFFVLSSASRHHDNLLHPQGGGTIVAEACKASRDPITCQSSLTGHVSNANPITILQAIQTAIDVSSQNLNTGRGMVQTILNSSSGNENLTAAANTCLEVLYYSEYRTNLAAEALPRGGAMKDARAWTSAALVYQYDCWSALKYVNTTSLVNKTMSFFYNSLIKSTGDTLAMMLNYDVHGEKTESWGPVKTERDGFWEPGSGNSGWNGFAGGVPKALKVDVTVCKNGAGTCNYQTVQEAVNAAPENNGDAKFVVWIKEGVYDEIVRVPLEKRNVVFLGDGMGKTVITGSLNVGLQGVSTYNSATVGVSGDGFMASGLTIQNTAGPDAHQAVAFRSDSDLSVIENCEFTGNQDTLYSHSLRQYFKSCRIQGNVDFIFGNSAAFFQDCIILVAPRQVNPEKGENNALTAHGRIDPGQLTGFVFQNCVINGTDSYMALYYKNPRKHKNFLGRPWKEYSRTVFLQCSLEALISPEGWLPWSGDFALKTLYYGEFKNLGPGSDTSRRVAWSSQIPSDHAYSYSVQNFIQGDQWIPTSS